jgi:hypothetical protein
MRGDPIVADVRRAREELSARFNFDVKAIFMRTRQVAVGSRLVSRKKRREVNGPAAQEKKSSPPVPRA